MKKFAQTAILVAGLVGLSACASNDMDSEPYGSRTAGSNTFAGVTYDNSTDALAACNERVARLEEMNKSCYRK